MKYLLALLILLVGLLGRVSAAPGDLDLTFGIGGKVTTDIGNDDENSSRVAVQGDGKIVVAGSSRNGINTDFALVRYNADGTLDVSFNGTGKVITEFPLAFPRRGAAANDIAIQGDGKIVVVGYAQVGDSSRGGAIFAVVRYNSNGTLDTSFNGSGKVTTPMGSISCIARAIAIQGDGKIVVGGARFDDVVRRFDFALVRYNTNGTLDTTFNGNGKVETDISGGNAICTRLVLQEDGKIVAAGNSGHGILGEGEIALVRYNANGTLDISFNSSGKATLGFDSSSTVVNGVMLQADAEIVVTACAWHDCAFFRYNSNGTLDTRFNGAGKVMTSIRSLGIFPGQATFQSDGKILVVGNGEALFKLLRFNANGSLDTNFSATGMVTTNISGREGYARDVLVQRDGKIVVVGGASNGSNNDIAVVRYLGDSTSATTLTNLPPVCSTDAPPAPAVRLNWTPSPLATSYDIYRNGTLYKSGLTDTSFYNSIGLAEGQSYTYKIVARHLGGTGDSNTITVAIPAGLCSSFGIPQVLGFSPDPIDSCKSSCMLYHKT